MQPPQVLALSRLSSLKRVAHRIGMAASLSSHVDEDGKPRMVDVGKKNATYREATATSTVQLPDSVVEKIVQDAQGNLLGPKGPIFHTAIVAGTQAAKQTSNLIPFCHPLPIEKCDISATLVKRGTIKILCTVAATHKTGVEMEALVGASTAALTIYDMLKGLSHDIRIENTMLLHKRGGKRDFTRPPL